MGELQYLIDGDDGFLYIVFKRSIIVKTSDKEITKDSIVNFLYPEDAVRPKCYRGKIILASENEDILKGWMTGIIQKRQRNDKPAVKRLLQQDPGKSKSRRRDAHKQKDLEMESEENNVKTGTPKIKPSQKEDKMLNRKKIGSILAAKMLLADLQSNTNSQQTTFSGITQIRAIEAKQPLKNNECLVKLKENVFSALVNAESVVKSLQEIRDDLQDFKEKSAFTPTSEPDEILKSDSSPPTSLPAQKMSNLNAREEDDVSCTTPTPIILEKNRKEDCNPSTSYERKDKSPNFCKAGGLSSSDDESSEEIPRELLDLETKSVFSPYRSPVQKPTPSNLSETGADPVLVDPVPDNDSANKESSSTVVPDSRDHNGIWTLRYTTKEKGKTELVKGSGVYVKKSAVEAAATGPKTQTSLARMLLKATFKKTALIECSLSGGKANGLGRTQDKEKRLGLHKGATEAILTFIRKYAEKEGWRSVDDRTIKASLRSKLTEMRKQHQLNNG